MERSTKHGTTGTTPSTPSTHGLVDLAPPQVEARMAEVTKHLDAIDALLLDAEGLNAAQRRKVARLRGDGEVAALSGILQFAAVHPELFGSLATEDDGNDPATFETTLLMNRLQNAQTIGAIADRFASLESRISSCVLNGVALVKPTTLMAYDIAKAVAGRVSRSELVYPAQDFYRAAAGVGSRARARKKAASTTPATETPSKPVATTTP